MTGSGLLRWTPLRELDWATRLAAYDFCDESGEIIWLHITQCLSDEETYHSYRCNALLRYC
jgi:hypothetical protein